MRPRLLEFLLVLFIWALLFAFILYDTPKMPEKVIESPSYWHWLDENYPREDTAHYFPAPSETPSGTPASAGDFYYGGTNK